MNCSLLFYLFLSFTRHVIHAYQFVASDDYHDQLPFQPSSPMTLSHSHSDILIPWTQPWLKHLERYAQAAGQFIRNGDTNHSGPHPVPPFPCRPFNDDDGIQWENRTVMNVRHRDVHIIAALGDSISAGFGMISDRLPNTRVYEYRGKVFSIGGDANEFTLPNLLARVTNTTIPVGAPTSISLPLTFGKALDRAVSGSTVQDLPEQAISLVTLLNLPPAVPFKNQWKLVTVLIGANNACRECITDGIDNVSLITTHLRTTLLTLRNAQPRWIINLMGMFKVSQVYNVAQPIEYCRNIFKRFPFCPCLHSEKSRHDMDTLVDQYNQAFQLIAHEFSLDPLFRVNYQPGFTDTDITKYGQDYLSRLDCFHPGHNANEVMAAITWDNMLEYADSKTTTYDPYSIQWKCPSVHNMYIH